MKIVIKGVGSYLPDIDSDILAEGAERAIPVMVHRAVKNCLNDAGRGMRDVSAVVTSSVDLWDGKTASNIGVTEAVGAVMRSETRINGDGLLALMHGAMMVMSGHYQSVLVVAHGKSSEGDTNAISNWTFDPVYQQTLKVTDLDAMNLQRQAFEQSKSGSDIINDVERALGTGDAPQGDGACAVLLEAGDAGISLEGFGYDLETHYLGDRDLAHSAGLGRAAERACQMAGGIDPKQDIKRYYWSLRTATQLPLWAEAVGIWSREQGGVALLADRHKVQWSGLPPFVAGLQRLVASVHELRNYPDVDRVLIQGCHGPAGQAQAVCLLKSEGAD